MVETTFTVTYENDNYVLCTKEHEIFINSNVSKNYYCIELKSDVYMIMHFQNGEMYLTSYREVLDFILNREYQFIFTTTSNEANKLYANWKMACNHPYEYTDFFGVALIEALSDFYKAVTA